MIGTRFQTRAPEEDVMRHVWIASIRGKNADSFEKHLPEIARRALIRKARSWRLPLCKRFPLFPLDVAQNVRLRFPFALDSGYADLLPNLCNLLQQLISRLRLNLKGAAASRFFRRVFLMSDDMEKKGQQGNQYGQGQQGGQSGQQGGQTGQQSGQTDKSGQNQQKKGGQNQTDEDDQNRDRQRRAS
jgi:hypothetical protein